MLKLWCVLWDHGEPTLKFDLLQRENFKFRLGSLLISWDKFELQLQLFRFQWMLKRAEGDVTMLGPSDRQLAEEETEETEEEPEEEDGDRWGPIGPGPFKEGAC